MRHRDRITWIVLLGVAGAAGILLKISTAEEQKKGSGPAPLVVDKNAPLLLEEPKKEPKKPCGSPKKPVADNSACYVCHENFREEPFVNVHARDDVGCAKCHGDSNRHMEDEAHLTPPDLMFPPEVIAPRCKACHKTHNAPAIEVLIRWRERCSEKTDLKSVLCMDCHGKHRLQTRRVRWDQRTGKVIDYKQVQCSTDSPPEDM